MKFIRLLKKKLKKYFLLIKRFFYKDFFIPFKGIRKNDILVFDDIFPHPISGFRLEEFKVLLNAFKKSKIVIDPTAYSIIKTPIEHHQIHIKEFEIQSGLIKKINIKKGFVNVNTKLFYCVFLHNISINLKWLEKFEIPFVFTLYPGGGFKINEDISDQKLEKVLTSPMFRKVIVTQNITYEYLLEKKLCKKENIEFIFGCVVPQISLSKDLTDKKTYLINKTTFDICFCAAKYTSKGEDKGYDIFIEFAKTIVNRYDFINFHIIGGFNEEDIDVSELKEKVKFYGYQNFDSLSSIFQKMDVLISPNKAFMLGKGAFDGFPLGTVVEAALNGVCVLITDELKQNNAFVPNVDLILIDSDIDSIVKNIINLIENPQKIYLISQNGKEKFIQVYSNETQMKPRIAILLNEIVETTK